jgi:poly-gamma-glutamate synthesis protein (capsule biosynthesis protein)
VHGHSSHHPKAIKVYRDRLILYGCGDFLNNYEGIAGYENYRGDLASGSLLALELVSLQIKKFRLARPQPSDFEFLRQTLDGECRRLGTKLATSGRGHFTLSWQRERQRGRA